MRGVCLGCAQTNSNYPKLLETIRGHPNSGRGLKCRQDADLRVLPEVSCVRVQGAMALWGSGGRRFKAARPDQLKGRPDAGFSLRAEPAS